MKKFTVLLIFLLTITFSISAEILIFKSTHYSHQILQDNKWKDWTEWQPSDVKIDIDLDTDIVTVYSKTKQIYQIYDFVGETENQGNITVTYRFINQDDERGNMRLLLRKNGQSEIYFDFANIRYAYIVKRVN